jgi:TonB family protein
MRRLWPGFLVLAASVAFASVEDPFPHIRPVTLNDREHQVWRTPARVTEFSDIPHLSARSFCEDSQPPEALTTPAPLAFRAAEGATVKVSIIVGADGRVHSPLILQSSGSVSDHNVLQTVRGWRYRPATCNGVPTEAEGKIEFSQR